MVLADPINPLPLAFAPLARPEPGTLRLRLTGATGTRFTLEQSSDLESWQTWVEDELTSNSTEIAVEDLDAPSGWLYRARQE